MYRRALVFDGVARALSVTQSGPPDAPRLSVTLSGDRLGEPTVALARETLDGLLGFCVDLSAFAAMTAEDPLMCELAARLRGLKPPRFPTVFEALVNAVACQQLTITVGIHLLNRLTAAWGLPVAGDPDGLRAFPQPAALAAVDPADIKAIGFSAAKARAIVEAAVSVAAGDVDLESLHGLDDRATMECLIGLRGVGRWTAEYVMLRGLGRLHMFPGDDVGARNKLKRFFDLQGTLDYDAIARLLARWQPYAGMIYFHLLLDSLAEAGTVG